MYLFIYYKRRRPENTLNTLWKDALQVSCSELLISGSNNESICKYVANYMFSIVCQFRFLHSLNAKGFPYGSFSYIVLGQRQRLYPVEYLILLYSISIIESEAPFIYWNGIKLNPILSIARCVLWGFTLSCKKYSMTPQLFMIYLMWSLEVLILKRGS